MTSAKTIPGVMWFIIAKCCSGFAFSSRGLVVFLYDARKRIAQDSGRRSRAAHWLQIFVWTLFCMASCAEKPHQDRCCTFSDLPLTSDARDGQGALHVEGSTAAYYYVFDEAGKSLTHKLLNETLNLPPGRYQVKVNNSLHSVEIQAGRLARCGTGTLITSGNTSDYYYVMDSTHQQLGYETLGKPMSFFPGIFHVKVNDTEMPVEVKLKELAQIRTGTLIVHGTTDEYYYVLDDSSKQLNYNRLEKPLAFFPGSYVLKVNNTSTDANIFAGQTTALRTGNLLVKGLTEEYYYVTDTLGNALNYQTLNKPMAFFPGDFYVKVNNTVVAARVSKDETHEFLTGSLILTGNGTIYYYVLDETGHPLNYNTLNRSLSFFPSEYTIRLGSSTRKAIVEPGELTSISVFD